MIYSVGTQEMAGRIDFEELCKYVSDIGWNKYQGKVADGIAIYQKVYNDKFYQIKIPCNREFADYSEAIYSTVNIIALTENKSVEQLILELLNPMSDILRVRHISSDVENGSIIVEDTIDNYNKMIENFSKYYSKMVDKKKKYKSLMFIFSIILIVSIIGEMIVAFCLLREGLINSVEILAFVIPIFLTVFISILIVCIERYLFPQIDEKYVEKLLREIVEKDKKKRQQK